MAPNAEAMPVQSGVNSSYFARREETRSFPAAPADAGRLQALKPLIERRVGYRELETNVYLIAGFRSAKGKRGHNDVPFKGLRRS
jgi:hypothetical protein